MYFEIVCTRCSGSSGNVHFPIGRCKTIRTFPFVGRPCQIDGFKWRRFTITEVKITIHRITNLFGVLQQYILIDVRQSTSIGGIYTVNFTEFTGFEVDAAWTDFLFHKRSIRFEQFVSVGRITTLQTNRDVTCSGTYTEITGWGRAIETEIIAREIETQGIRTSTSISRSQINSHILLRIETVVRLSPVVNCTCGIVAWVTLKSQSNRFWTIRIVRCTYRFDGKLSLAVHAGGIADVNNRRSEVIDFEITRLRAADIKDG